MDIQHLVDRLEDIIDEGRHIPMTKLTVVDEERALEIIDQMRISIPEEIEKASRVLTQRDRILAQANEEATRLVDLAREKSETLVQRDVIVQTAQNRAANIIEQARQDAEAMRADADDYVLDTLDQLEAQLLKTLTVVRNGINKMRHERTAEAPAASPMLPAAVDPAQPVEAAPLPAKPKSTPVPAAASTPIPFNPPQSNVEVSVDPSGKEQL